MLLVGVAWGAAGAAPCASTAPSTTSTAAPAMLQLCSRHDCSAGVLLLLVWLLLHHYAPGLTIVWAVAEASKWRPCCHHVTVEVKP